MPEAFRSKLTQVEVVVLCVSEQQECANDVYQGY